MYVYLMAMCEDKMQHNAVQWPTEPQAWALHQHISCAVLTLPRCVLQPMRKIHNGFLLLARGLER